MNENVQRGEIKEDNEDGEKKSTANMKINYISHFRIQLYTLYSLKSNVEP